jgi:prolyl-tRNA editing enzyme YbaK/EbsC (Cys-tRNA(Pro) deacylase)
MLSEFIERNDLKSELIDFSSTISTDRLISKGRFPSNLVVKIQLFNTEKNNPFIIIAPFHSELDFEKIKKISSDEEIIEMDHTETAEMTGYKKEKIPPISIYGIKIIIDSSLENKNHLFCRVGEKKFLKVILEEIIEFNDEVEFEQITK